MSDIPIPLPEAVPDSPVSRRFSIFISGSIKSVLSTRSPPRTSTSSTSQFSGIGLLRLTSVRFQSALSAGFPVFSAVASMFSLCCIFGTAFSDFALRAPHDASDCYRADHYRRKKQTSSVFSFSFIFSLFCRFSPAHPLPLFLLSAACSANVTILFTGLPANSNIRGPIESFTASKEARSPRITYSAPLDRASV